MTLSPYRALANRIRVATLSLKLDTLISRLEWRYRPNQPRAPRGTSEGGQWIDDLSVVGPVQTEPERVLVAGPRCDGFSGGCSVGGSYGTTGMYTILGKRLCRSCALKLLGIEGLPHTEQQETLDRFGPRGQ
jgi:hypothetical protein